VPSPGLRRLGNYRLPPMFYVMRRMTLALMAIVVVLAPAVAHGAVKRHKRAPTCPPPHAHVVLRDTAAVVFRLEAPDPGFFEEAACSDANTKPFVLFECEEFLLCEGPEFADLTLAGKMLAYERYGFTGSSRYMTAEPSSWLIQVRDLRTHRLVHSSPTSTSEPPPSKVIGNGPAQGIVVKNDGSVAWIAVDGERPFASTLPTTYQVWKVDRTGQHLLAMGTQVVPNSIALAGSTVYWTNRGAPELATLN
jgi:hypothetical protein